MFDPTLLHERNGRKSGGCNNIRERIQAGIEAHLTEDWLQRNVSGSDGDYLHHHESCPCDMGKIGQANKLAANKKRSDFYKTEHGQEIRNRKKLREEDKEKTLATVMEYMETYKNGTNKDNIKDNIKKILNTYM